MLPIAKVFTLNKLHLLENLCSQTGNGMSPLPDYFQFGRPYADPPLMRGSMMLSLRQQFLADNADFFDYGSPVDTGGIRFGFIRTPNPDTFLAETMCDYTKFSRLIAELSELPRSVCAELAAHRRTALAIPVLKKHLSPIVTSFMVSNDQPYVWSFEFCLHAGYRLTPQHVEELAFPNTYGNLPIFRRLVQLLRERVRVFNPRAGCPGA